MTFAEPINLHRKSGMWDTTVALLDAHQDPSLTATEKSNLYYYRGRIYQYRAQVGRYLGNTAAGFPSKPG